MLSSVLLIILLIDRECTNDINDRESTNDIKCILHLHINVILLPNNRIGVEVSLKSLKQ